MIFNVAIHVQVEEGREDSNAEGIDTTKVNDCMCEMHDAWWRVNPIPTTYKWPQVGQGTRKRYLWDR